MRTQVDKPKEKKKTNNQQKSGKDPLCKEDSWIQNDNQR
jgi:hypothetical protein